MNHKWQSGQIKQRQTQQECATPANPGVAWARATFYVTVMTVRLRHPLIDCITVSMPYKQ